MSYQSQLWDGESAMDDWYSKAVASNEEVKTTPTSSNMMYATEAAFNRDSTALPSASFYDENDASEAVTENEESATHTKRELRVSTDKPLPALPKIKGAYFEYMFSDAEFGQQNDEDEEGHIAGLESKSLTFTDLLGPSPSPSQYSFYDVPTPSSEDQDDLPSTPTTIADPRHYAFDGAPIKQETPTSPTFAVFNDDGSPPVIFAAPIIPIASTNIASSPPVSFLSIIPVANATNVAAVVAVTPLFESEEETESADATAGFYGGFAVEQSPSPYHAPLIDDCAGFGDIRDGCEQFPEQWTDAETQAELVAPYKLTGLQTFSDNLELLAAKPVKPVLKPKSQIAKAAKTCDMGFGYNHRASSTPRFTALSGFSDEVVAQLNGTKRPAQNSILSTASKDLDDADHDEDEEDEFEETQSAKKARLSSDNTMDADAVYAPMPSTLSVYPNLKHKSSARSITNSLFNKTVDFAPTVDGYPGQFKALLPPSKIFHPKFLSGGRPDKVTFGNESHANGLFHHTRFQAGGNTPFNEFSLDFSQSAVPSVDGPLGKAIKIADHNHDMAAGTKRTVEQEALRRETHFECSLARLEGVPVGEYRYYQGHSNIEEYSKGGMCICWVECFCTKMCTKYADMVCPCAKYVAFEE